LAARRRAVYHTRHRVLGSLIRRARARKPEVEVPMPEMSTPSTCGPQAPGAEPAAAAAPVALEGLDLAALLCSRVCHDLISPVGAIVNGMEVLEDTDDESTRSFALDLIKKSATQASAKLQFCRLAFGAAGSAGAEIDLGDAEGVARGFIEDDKTSLCWQLARAYAAKNRVKLLLNMLILAAAAIPRGGTITVEPAGEGAAGFRITASGLNARVPAAAAALIAGEAVNGVVDAQAIQPFYTGLLARACGLAVTVQAEGSDVTIAAG
jgi:histidine phosphotransferase ChpT